MDAIVRSPSRPLPRKKSSSFQVKLEPAIRRSFTDNRSSEIRISSLIEDPIGCGFFLCYCEQHYAEENLNFIIEVNRYMELFHLLDPDRVIWSQTWRQLDALSADEDSPANYSVFSKLKESLEQQGGRTKKWSDLERICKDAEAKADFIRSKYIVNDAPNQICLSSKVFQSTDRRLLHIGRYGPEVFGETCLDPVLTLCKDILPRFLKSELCVMYRMRSSELLFHPPSTALKVPPPDVQPSLYCQNDLSDSRRFTLNELLREGFLYNEFLAFLERRVCAENLYCYRLITIFEDLTKRNAVDEANELAWTIYKFFIAQGSSYEVSCPSNVRNELMRQLAQPKLGMFHEIQKSAYEQLQALQLLYSKTPDYRQLGTALRESIYRKVESSSSESVKLPSLRKLLSWKPRSVR